MSPFYHIIFFPCQVIDTREKGLRRSVPKGFPYFSVSFGMGGGFAHVIEDEAQFPRHFGAEIIGFVLPNCVAFETCSRTVAPTSTHSPLYYIVCMYVRVCVYVYLYVSVYNCNVCHLLFWCKRFPYLPCRID